MCCNEAKCYLVFQFFCALVAIFNILQATTDSKLFFKQLTSCANFILNILKLSKFIKNSSCATVTVVTQRFLFQFCLQSNRGNILLIQ